jgi:hypothetical protein
MKIQKNFAVLVSISNYIFWDPLPSSDRHLLEIKDILVKSNSFENSIFTLSTQNYDKLKKIKEKDRTHLPYKQNIIDLFDDLSEKIELLIKEEEAIEDEYQISVFVYIVGHGLINEGVHYLFPLKTKKPPKKRSLISIEEEIISHFVQFTSNKNFNMVFFIDTCREYLQKQLNPIQAQSHIQDRILIQDKYTTDHFISDDDLRDIYRCYGCRKGQVGQIVTQIDDNNYSIFSKALITFLKTGLHYQISLNDIYLSLLKNMPILLEENKIKTNQTPHFPNDELDRKNLVVLGWRKPQFELANDQQEMAHSDLKPDTTTMFHDDPIKKKMDEIKIELEERLKDEIGKQNINDARKLDDIIQVIYGDDNDISKKFKNVLYPDQEFVKSFLNKIELEKELSKQKDIRNEKIEKFSIESTHPNQKDKKNEKIEKFSIGSPLSNYNIKIIFFNFARNYPMDHLFKQSFTRDYKLTVGVDILRQSFEREPYNTLFSFWTISLLERFSFIRTTFYRNAFAAVIILECKNSMVEKTKNMISELRVYIKKSPIILFVIKDALNEEPFYLEFQNWCKIENIVLKEMDVSKKESLSPFLLTICENVFDSSGMLLFPNK